MSHQPENISAGTQVVALVEARGPNGSLVHPRGAVGVVTRTPAVAGENFLVRFPDGFEKTLERSQIEVLKHFKDRLWSAGGPRVLAPICKWGCGTRVSIWNNSAVWCGSHAQVQDCGFQEGDNNQLALSSLRVSS
jgi:hypothetical protein